MVTDIHLIKSFKVSVQVTSHAIPQAGGLDKYSNFACIGEGDAKNHTFSVSFPIHVQEDKSTTLLSDPLTLDKAFGFSSHAISLNGGPVPWSRSKTVTDMKGETQ